MKKIVLILFATFIIFNTWFFGIKEYQEYVLKAPEHLKEARKDFHKAMFFNWYYSIVIKMTGLDFENSILSPLKKPMDYYYKRGLSKLPKNEAERALWFFLFEIRPYNQSYKGKYGKLFQNNGLKYTKNYLQRIFDNLRILDKYEISDKNSYLVNNIFKSYIHAVQIYLQDSPYSDGGHVITSKFISKIVRSDYNFYKVFVYIHRYKQRFLEKYSKIFPTIYKNSFDKEKLGWYSLHRRNSIIDYYLNSYILFYKIHNDEINCIKDKYLFDARKKAINTLFELNEYSKESNKEDILDLKAYFDLNFTDKNEKQRFYTQKFDCSYVIEDNKIVKVIKTYEEIEDKETIYKETTFKDLLQAYRTESNYKAIAGFKKNGVYEGIGYSSGNISQKIANKKALDSCKGGVEKKEDKEKCRLYKYLIKKEIQTPDL